MKINPNRAKSLKEKNRLLAKLLFEFKKALDNNWNPNETKIDVTPVYESEITVQEAFQQFEAHKLSSPYSIFYKRQLSSVSNQFLNFLSDKEKVSTIKNLNPFSAERFLNQFKGTPTQYMNKRRALGVFMAEFVRKKYIPVNYAKSAPRLKTKATLHKTYTKEQLTALLNHLKATNYELYLCCLISYGCLLRPHHEIRFLKKKHFNQDYTQISLSGFENKSARIRVVGVPEYVRKDLIERLTKISNPDANIFSLTVEPYNEYYFSLNWTRARPALLADGLLQPDQTIYSFRHTAAVDVYTRTKDLHIVQQLMGHSTMVVTLKYLRGLGEINIEQLKDVLPMLEI
ncbi:tyrosine-type recombinase/integrase [Mucilaginibacter rubeus]|uniref:tyrosine-type recombinase/integrase n=1 Tax=Mucilaginibacter rubeus TaxID=2027860 RepID=UPI0016810D28|nr:tyrosine-type recombinase/integrase [Mucilaginibacter rubeus]